MSAFSVGLEEITALMWKDLLDKYDVMAIIDGNRKNRHGLVGLGKTNFGLQLALRLNPYFWPPENMIIRDNYLHFLRALTLNVPYTVTLWDEMEWFFNKQTWSKPFVKILTPEFMSNRKDLKVWLGIIPSWWFNVEFVRDNRPQWRFRMNSRTECEVYVHNGRSEMSEDWWGAYVTTIEKIPSAAEKIPALWHMYEALIAAHPRPCSVDEWCVTALQSMPSEKVWKLIESFFSGPRERSGRNIFTTGPTSPSIEEKPRKEKKRSKPPGETSQLQVPKETYPLLMGRTREETI